MKSTITGWGKCAPDNIMTNDDLAVFVDTSDEWIQQRTGIQERRFCHVNNSDMATVAGHHAIACAGLTPEDIDVVILATCTPDSIVPSAAAHVQKKLGAVNAAVYDVNAACAGFVYALEQGKAFVESGLYKRALVIGSEHITWLLDWSDRNTAVLFGDGAGALAIEATNVLDNFIAFDMRTDGERGSFLNLPSKNNKDSIVDEIDFLSGGFSPIQMNGQEVYKFAVKEVPLILQKLLKKMKYNSDQVDWLLLHQANQRILDSVGERLKIPREKILSNLEKYGNTSAATIPLMMDEAVRDYRIKQNDIIATSGFGAGLSWGAALIKWG